MGNAIYRMVNGDGKTYPYQHWENHTDSPELTVDFPYQYIYETTTSGLYGLVVCETPLFYHSLTYLSSASGSAYKVYFRQDGYLDGDWYYITGGVTPGTGTPYNNSLLEANDNIYKDESLTEVFFSTTTAITVVPIRIRNVRHKGESFLRDKALRCKSTAWERVNL